MKKKNNRRIDALFNCFHISIQIDRLSLNTIIANKTNAIQVRRDASIASIECIKGIISVSNGYLSNCILFFSPLFTINFRIGVLFSCQLHLCFIIDLKISFVNLRPNGIKSVQLLLEVFSIAFKLKYVSASPQTN